MVRDDTLYAQLFHSLEVGGLVDGPGEDRVAQVGHGPDDARSEDVVLPENSVLLNVSFT